jgi:hypothetical protein
MTATTSPAPSPPVPDQVQAGTKHVLLDDQTLTIAFEFKVSELDMIFRQRFTEIISAMARKELKQLVENYLRYEVRILAEQYIRDMGPALKDHIQRIWDNSVEKNVKAQIEAATGRACQDLTKRILGR